MSLRTKGRGTVALTLSRTLVIALAGPFTLTSTITLTIKLNIIAPSPLTTPSHWPSPLLLS